MKITRLELFHVRPRWLFLKLHTDAGLVGLGEPILEGRAQTVETAVRELGRMIVGQDPRRIEHLWQLMYRCTFYRGGPVLTSAISGIEQALWDILGKHLNVPVYQLLGGAVRDKVRLYGRLNPRDDEQTIRQAHERGRFTAYKFSWNGPMRLIETPATLEAIAAGAARLRQAIGPAVDLALDCHGRTTPAVAIRLARLMEPAGLMFMEEPVLPGDTLALKRISASTTIPIATGERLFTRWQFQDVIEQEAVAILQPDLSHVGGIFEARKIAAMAESRNLAVAPHCPLGPIALAASIQFAACTPNFLCQEHVTLGETYLKQPFVAQDGYVPIPTAPGLGVELDDEKVQAGLFAGDWDTPQQTLEDGSIAEW